MVLPPGYASHPGQRYGVLYLLHGFPGEPAQFLNVGQVASTEATLVAAGQIKPVILVMPSGSRSLLADKEWANGISRANAWESFVARDLVHAIDARYRTIARASGRGIAGLSEGGYGAFNIGLHHPGEFGLLESWSGYVTATTSPPSSAATRASWPTTARRGGSRPSPVRCGLSTPMSGSTAASVTRSRRRTAPSPPRSPRWASGISSSRFRARTTGGCGGADAPGADRGVGAPEPWLGTCAAAWSSRPG